MRYMCDIWQGINVYEKRVIDGISYISLFKFSLIRFNFFESRNHVLFIIDLPRPDTGFDPFYSLNMCASFFKKKTERRGNMQRASVCILSRH